MIRPRLCQKTLGVDHIGRGSDLFPVPLRIDPEILFSLFDRLFRHPDLLSRLLEQQVGVFDLEDDPVPDVGQSVRRLAFPTEARFDAVFRLPPFPEIPLGRRHYIPTLLILVIASGKSRRVAESRVVSDQRDARVIFAFREFDQALRPLHPKGV